MMAQNVEARVTTEDEHESVWFLGSRFTVLAAAEDTGGAYGLIDATLPVGFGPPPHVHHREDEQFLILDGHVTFIVGGQTLDAPAGSFVTIPRDVPHAFQVIGDRPCRMLQLTTPGGLERFFVESGDPVTDPSEPPAPPAVERMLGLFPKYGLELVG